MPSRFRGDRSRAQMIDAMPPRAMLLEDIKSASAVTSLHSSDSPCLKQRRDRVVLKLLAVFENAFGSDTARKRNSPVASSASTMLPRWALSTATVSSRIDWSSSVSEPIWDRW